MTKTPEQNSRDQDYPVSQSFRYVGRKEVKKKNQRIGEKEITKALNQLKILTGFEPPEKDEGRD